jgi:hypothetical protein
LEAHQNIYDLRFHQAISRGISPEDAAIAVAEDYLDGKPGKIGKNKLKAADRNAAFWSSQFLWTQQAELFQTDPLVLALARYLGQESTANFELLVHVAGLSPETVQRAVRYSGLVLRQHSERWLEVERLAGIHAAQFSELIRICHRFDLAHRDSLALVESSREPLACLTPLELLSYASLYAFEHLVPRIFLESDSEVEIDNTVEEVWYALHDILIWKLHTSTDEVFHLTDTTIAHSLRDHLSPFLFASPELPKDREGLYLAFRKLVAAQVELNSFLTRSVDEFCYNDSISFAFVGAEMVIVQRDIEAGNAWRRNGEKLMRLHNYWFYRALYDFVASGIAEVQIGRPENHEGNRMAFIKAIRTQLQLQEVYGIDESLLTGTGLRVDLFQALLSLELMTAFFINDYVLPYGEFLSVTGHWQQALAGLAIGGLLNQDFHQPQNRLPLTWSDRQTKIETILPWTVSNDFPQGHPKIAEAILDFWTCDLKDWSARLRSDQPNLNPQLFERPVLKMGRYLFQLPWMVAMQNNPTAAINNLRRIGARRPEAGQETRRIEQQLGKKFEQRGFRVCLNYQPEKTEFDDPGEVDLICLRDGELLVLEIKSTFLRHSMKEAWLHKMSTLRKAGIQLRRKVEAVKMALNTDTQLACQLGLGEDVAMPQARGWIVDTCIEHDHEFFSGFRKVSLEEILIALRDDRHLLNDPLDLFCGGGVDLGMLDPAGRLAPSTLYPAGFTGTGFIDTIERQAVWSSVVEK